METEGATTAKEVKKIDYPLLDNMADALGQGKSFQKELTRGDLGELVKFALESGDEGDDLSKDVENVAIDVGGGKLTLEIKTRRATLKPVYVSQEGNLVLSEFKKPAIAIFAGSEDKQKLALAEEQFNQADVLLKTFVADQMGLRGVEVDKLSVDIVEEVINIAASPKIRIKESIPTSAEEKAGETRVATGGTSPLAHETTAIPEQVTSPDTQQLVGVVKQTGSWGLGITSLREINFNGEVRKAESIISAGGWSVYGAGPKKDLLLTRVAWRKTETDEALVDVKDVDNGKYKQVFVWQNQGPLGNIALHGGAVAGSSSAFMTFLVPAEKFGDYENMLRDPIKLDQFRKSLIPEAIGAFETNEFGSVTKVTKPGLHLEPPKMVKVA